MAVNNYAPAEYGGYVLGANSGGGGGGSSPFEEQYGVAGWYDVEITFQLPESSTDSLEEASISATIEIQDVEGIGIMGIYSGQELHTLLISNNKYTLHIPYLTGNDLTSTFRISSVHSSDTGYFPVDSGYICSGGVEWDSDNFCFNVTGDGSVTVPLQEMD